MPHITGLEQRVTQHGAQGGCEREREACLHLVPRRTPEDAISFEPADLLQRVDDALNAKSMAWREVGINIRRWGERTLAAISGYCPIPFVRYNDIPGS